MTGLRFRPWVAVHRGPHQVRGCPQAAAALVRTAGLRVRYVGQGERLSMARALEQGPAALVHPGGGDLEQAWSEVGRDRQAVRAYVGAGGCYLGLCLGGYLAGRTPGYGLFAGDTDQLVGRPRSPLRTTDEAVVEVVWDGAVRHLYVQDPPVFLLDPRTAGGARPTVVATYAQGDPAALVAPFGRGYVALCGPHPEAAAGWFRAAGLPAVPSARDLGLDLLRRLGLGTR